MFIRTKTIKGRPRFYLVENTRQDGKVKQKVIAYLGEHETLEAAIAQLEKQIANYKRHMAEVTDPAYITMRGTRLPLHYVRRITNDYTRRIQQLESKLEKLQSIVVPKPVNNGTVN